jgi:hypothetical protein
MWHKVVCCMRRERRNYSGAVGREGSKGAARAAHRQNDGGHDCDILAKGLLGLLEYSYH